MKTNNFEVNAKMYDEIASLIGSDASPVGIDAKKTHILILNKLHELGERLKKIEQKLNAGK